MRSKELCLIHNYFHFTDQYLKQGMQKFEDNVLLELQLLKVVYGDKSLMDELTAVIVEVVKNGGEVSKE